ncbi:hypothetical protein [Mesorhizobium sp. 1M-11]|uniref:hypothetical protein n=1 Tax=Mesorhizobium sp. 1M-11 TaxID=1529006 RepID=UPI0006C7702A|nr:hypothetical protein [Mesorhizobium sp. 1M-11]
MLKKQLSLAVSALIMLGTASETVAGGRAVECYEPYRTRPVYDTIYGEEQVSPGYSRVVRTPPIYGTRQRAVLIRPERVSYEVIPAVVDTRYRTIQVSDGGYGWEWRWINGRRVLCKIKYKPRYERVAETVVIQPESRRRVVIPAEYGYETEQVVIQPGSERVLEVPPSYRQVARRVMVSEGQTGWRRVHIPRHCQY